MQIFEAPFPIANPLQVADAGHAMSVRDEVILVEHTHRRERLDIFLQAQFPMVSRGAIQRLIAQGDIRVNGQVVKSAHTPRAGERIDVHWPAPKADTAQPESIPLDILYEDEALLVLNKPAGLVVHPAVGHRDHTLVNALLHHCGKQLSGIGGVARPGIVHRLDKETSGCLVVAKTDAAHLSLSEQFKQRQVNKVYHALVCGVLPRLTGEIKAAIGRHPTHRKHMSVTPNRGRVAWTSYRVLQQYPAAALLEIQLHTGRTHQVRVHFQHLGFPLVGDLTYGKRPNQRLTETTGYTAPRHLLHACQLAFTHPSSREKLVLRAPWPADFQAAVDALKS